MKRLLALSFLGSSLLIGSNPAIADWDIWGLKKSESDSRLYDVYTLDSDTQEATKVTQVCTDNRSGCINWHRIYVNQPNLNGFLVETSSGTFSEYDLTTNTWSASNGDGMWEDDYDDWFLRTISISQEDGSVDYYHKGTHIYNIKEDGTLRFGSNTSDISVTSTGLISGENNVLIRKTNGDIHIGKNSFVIGDDLIDGAHPIWAEDENGTKVPLNIYGSDLQINGVSVQTQIDSNTSNISTNTSNISTNTSNISTNTSNISTNTSNISTNTSNISTNTSNIKNLGEGVAGSTALTAALTALPQTSKESKLNCGVGSGAYSSRYAVGFGCASKINERVDINAGGSYVFGGSKSYGGGTLDSGVVKAGFVFKLGELNKPTQISMKDKKVMETKIENLEEKNKQLLARLERLEKIALGESKSKDLAVYQLK